MVGQNIKMSEIIYKNKKGYAREVSESATIDKDSILEYNGNKGNNEYLLNKEEILLQCISHYEKINRYYTVAKASFSVVCIFIVLSAIC